MNVDHSGRVLQSGRAVALGKEIPPAPTTAKPYVSAASIFKRAALKSKPAEITPKPTVNTHLTAKVSPVRKPKSAKTRASPQSPQKKGWSVEKKRRDDMHPLAVAFKGTAIDYRIELYNRATAKLDSTFNHLIASLHECNLATVSSPPNASNPNASPIKLTLPAKYDRATRSLFKPIGNYSVTSHTTNETGEQVTTTLEEKLVSFEKRYLKDVQEIKKLESQWENIVGEIWKVGVSCLGEEVIRSLLLTSPASSSPALDVHKESTLFVPEQGDSPVVEPKETKKRVTFQTPQPELPKFLFTPSMFRKYPIPSLPKLPEKEAQELENIVAELGSEQVEELKKIDKEQQKWWNKKSQQIAMTLRED